MIPFSPLMQEPLFPFLAFHSLTLVWTFLYPYPLNNVIRDPDAYDRVHDLSYRKSSLMDKPTIANILTIPRISLLIIFLYHTKKKRRFYGETILFITFHYRNSIWCFTNIDCINYFHLCYINN